MITRSWSKKPCVNGELGTIDDQRFERQKTRNLVYKLCFAMTSRASENQNQRLSITWALLTCHIDEQAISECCCYRGMSDYEVEDSKERGHVFELSNLHLTRRSLRDLSRLFEVVSICGIQSFCEFGTHACTLVPLLVLVLEIRQLILARATSGQIHVVG